MIIALSETAKYRKWPVHYSQLLSWMVHVARLQYKVAVMMLLVVERHSVVYVQDKHTQCLHFITNLIDRANLARTCIELDLQGRALDQHRILGAQPYIF